MPTTVTGCAHFTPSPKPAPRQEVRVPPDVRAVFEHLASAPGQKGQPITQAQAFAAVAELRGSEVDKAKAGKRLLAIVDAYNANVRAFNAKLPAAK